MNADIVKFCAKCQRSYLRQKQIILTLQILGNLGYIALCIILPTYIIINSVDRYGQKILFTLIIPLIWAILALISNIYTVRCCRAVAQLARGETAKKTGYITEIDKNGYKIADILPAPGSRKKPQFTKPAYFHIPAGRRARDFSLGEKITVVYARAREINIYDRLHISAICAY